MNIIHNPEAKGSSPRYKIMGADGKIISKPKGVTTLLGAVLAKDFVSWALDCMAEALQGKLPVITQADLDDAKLASTRKRDSGANTGTETHYLVEQFLKNLNTENWNRTVTGSTEAMNAYGSFLDWFSKVNPEVINVEEIIYSKEFDFAGSYDCMLRVSGKVYLVDLKTTNPSSKAPVGVYAENFIQLGAYALAHEEQRTVDTNLVKIDGLMVVSAKKNGKLDIVTNEDVGLTVEDCGTMFKRVVNLFNFLKYTTTRLGGK